MLTNFIIVILSLIILVSLHEFSHFILAKKFGVKVEEFGIGYPPRLIGKKFGETVYSLNLLPFGAFVRVPDDESFLKKAIWKRALIISGGVISFWIIATILFSFAFNLGTPTVIEDSTDSSLISPRVQIVDIAPNSPAEKQKLRVGDIIKKLEAKDSSLETTKVKEVQDFINNHLGQNITLIIERGKETLRVNITPRKVPPEGEGPMGVALIRTAIKKYPFFQAIWQGTLTTKNFTLAIIQGYFSAILKFFRGVPTGIQLTGPIGVFGLLSQASQLGLSYYMSFLGLISVYLALFNILPIPVVDGGKLLFLGIEAIRKKPIPQKIEKKITAFFFIILIALMVWVSIQDITRYFY